MPSSRQGGSPRAVSIASSLGRAAHAILPRRHRARRGVPDSAASAPTSPSPAHAVRLGRLVTDVFNVCHQLDPDGLGIRRASSAIHPSAFSPFLLLDHCGPHRLAPRADLGGEAPRCGQQALSYVVRGEMRYRDSCGNATVLRSGSVNLLTAGSGLAVSHSLRGPIIEYFSIWINIPRDLKSSPPEQRMTENPPCVTIGHGESAATIRVLAGPSHRHDTQASDHDAKTRGSSLDLETAAGKAAVYDVKMQRKSQLVLNPETQRVFVYVYRGAAVIAKKTKVQEGDFAVLEPNRELPVVIDSCGVHTETEEKPHYNFDNFDEFEEHACWCLVLAGDPVLEPVSMLSSGIVACTPQEIRKAFQEYTCGSMGTSNTAASNPLTSGAKLVIDSDEDSVEHVNSESEQPGTDDGILGVGFGNLEI